MFVDSSANFFERFASKATMAAGSSWAFITALLTVIVWIITGPIFNYSDTWQLVINTGTTIITFLMVFLIQKSQNKDSLAMQIKLNELIAVNRKASNRLLNIEDLTETELRALHKFFGKLAEKAKDEADLDESHSIEEAEDIHDEKVEALKLREEARRRHRPAQKNTLTNAKKSARRSTPYDKNSDQ